MKLTPTQVALNALKKAPVNRYCYLWIKPISNEYPFIEAFALIQPLKPDNSWHCVGKIKNSGEEDAIKDVVDRINFVLDMLASWGSNPS